MHACVCTTAEQQNLTMLVRIKAVELLSDLVTTCLLIQSSNKYCIDVFTMKHSVILLVCYTGDWRLPYWRKSGIPFLTLPPPNVKLSGWRDPYVIGEVHELPWFDLGLTMCTMDTLLVACCSDCICVLNRIRTSHFLNSQSWFFHFNCFVVLVACVHRPSTRSPRTRMAHADREWYQGRRRHRPCVQVKDSDIRWELASSSTRYLFSHQCKHACQGIEHLDSR